jgi:hypothetical protein
MLIYFNIAARTTALADCEHPDRLREVGPHRQHFGIATAQRIE